MNPNYLEFVRETLEVIVERQEAAEEIIHGAVHKHLEYSEYSGLFESMCDMSMLINIIETLVDYMEGGQS